jgi:hypothetical protein
MQLPTVVLDMSYASIVKKLLSTEMDFLRDLEIIIKVGPVYRCCLSMRCATVFSEMVSPSLRTTRYARSL